jgi:poly(A) polymerase
MNQPPSKPIRLERPEHRVSRSLIDTDVLWILRRLRREGYKSFLVGGAVRDILLGIEPKDFDVGTDARPSELRRLFRNLRLIGRRFRIAHIYFRRKGQPEKIIEVSTFRGTKQREESDDIPPEDLDLTGTVFGSPEEDAWRRDFTINALFYDLSDFSVVDHTGGLKDLEAGLIRLVGDPDDRFEEDPVRMLRAVEFAVRLGFRIEEATEEGIKRNATRIAEASPARLREEVRQMQQRGILTEALAMSRRLGMLETLYPELTETEGMFALMEGLDAKASAGEPQPEFAYLAAMCMPTVAAACPLGPQAGLEEAVDAIYPVVGGICARYQISSHIRHQARELLLSCYRIGKGKGYRAKGRFVRKPEFALAWEFFKAWAGIQGELDETVAYWEKYLEENGSPKKGGGASRRPRRRRPRRRRRPKTASEKSES